MSMRVRGVLAAPCEAEDDLKTPIVANPPQRFYTRRVITEMSPTMDIFWSR